MAGSDLMKSLLDMGQDQGDPSQKFAFVANEDPENQELANQVMRDKASAMGDVVKWRTAAKDDYRYYYGWQWPDMDRMRMEQLRRPALVFNEIAPKLDAVSGIERRNRQEVRFVSRALDSDMMHDAAGDLATEAVSTVEDNSEGEDSRAIKDMSVGGMGWCEVRVDYTTDLDGMVIKERLDPFEMLWDTKSKKDNLLDARWYAREKPFSRKDFKKRWPDKIDTVDNALTYYSEDDTKKYELVTPYYSRANENANPEIGSGQTKVQNNINVIQYQWIDQVPVYRIADPSNPEGLQTLTDVQWKSLQAKMEVAGTPMPKAVRQLKSVYKQVYVAMGVVLEEPTVLPSGFSLIPVTGQYDSEKKCWYGIVRGLKDPQNTENKAVSALVTQFITNTKGGFFFKTGTFADVNMAKQQITQPDSFIEVNADKNIQTDIVQREPVQISQVPPLLFQQSQTSITRSSGINDDMIGLGTGDGTGPTMDKRMQGGLVILGWFWDNISRFRKQGAKVILEFIREYWTHGQLIRVGGNFNSQSIPLLKSSLPLDYEMVLDDSVKFNPNLKAQVWQDLMQIAGPLMKIPAGQMIFMKALKFSPFPAQLVAEIQEAAANAPPPPPKGRQGAGKAPENPDLVQAKIGKMSADTQKSLAEARAIDREGNLDIARVAMEGVHKSAQLHHQHQQKVLAERAKLAKSMYPQPQQNPTPPVM